MELKQFETFPVHVVLNDNTQHQNIDMVGIDSIDKTMLELDIQKSGEEYYCQAQLKADVTLQCARCLKHFKHKLANETDFIASSSNPVGEKLVDDEDRVYYDNDLSADLWEIVRQTVILAVSMKPLCSDNCRGLCPQCGINLNFKNCNCSTSSVDARLEPLKKLLEPNNRKGL
ncbi:MAG: YceD family protein [Candidatus Zixiibacteriota bacterium]